MTDLLPHDLSAERCAVASMVLCGDDRVTFSRIRRQLWPGAFMGSDVSKLSTIFRTLCAMDDKGVAVDAITLIGNLRERGALEDVGGRKGIVELVQDTVPDYANGPHYAGIVARLARRREAIAVTERLRQALMGGNDEGAIEDAARKLWQAATAGKDLNIWKLGDAIQRFVEKRTNGDRTIALDSGVAELDREYRGAFTFGGYTLVAARPSMGKSTAIRWLLKGLAESGTPVGLIAVEENEDKIAGNVLSAHTDIENSHIAYGRWTNTDQRAIGDAMVDLAGIPFFGIDCAMTLPDVLTAAEMLVTQHGCKVVAVDHIHLIDNARSRAENRNQQLGEISNALKSLFKRSGVVGIVAAQLNRPEKGAIPPPPQLTDLRDSGSLEEHADAVLMLHRKDYYMRGRDNYTPDGLAQWFIRKNRNGCVGEIVLKADLQHQRFMETFATVEPFETAPRPYRSNYDPFENV